MAFDYTDDATEELTDLEQFFCHEHLLPESLWSTAKSLSSTSLHRAVGAEGLDNPVVEVMASENRPSHKHLMIQLLNNGTYSDCTIICRNRSFPVHQAIISERCGVFKAALSSRMQEGIEKKITLPQDDPDAVHGMLFYLYTFCYPKEFKERLHCELLALPSATPEYFAQLGKLHWLYDLELYKVAHKNSLDYLAKLAKEQLNRLCTISAPVADPASFLHRVSGYAALVEQMYYKLYDGQKEEGNDERNMYVELLEDSRKLLLASSSMLVLRILRTVPWTD